MHCRLNFCCFVQTFTEMQCPWIHSSALWWWWPTNRISDTIIIVSLLKSHKLNHLLYIWIIWFNSDDDFIRYMFNRWKGQQKNENNLYDKFIEPQLFNLWFDLELQYSSYRMVDDASKIGQSEKWHCLLLNQLHSIHWFQFSC